MKERIKAYYEHNKAGIHREGRFWLVLTVWIAFFVSMNRSDWQEADERDQIQTFSNITTTSLREYERRTTYWTNISRRLSAFANAMSPAELKSHLGTWSALFEHQPEWLATHIVMRRQGFEPSISASMVSSKAMKLFENDKNSPIPWSNEIQANALQLISGITGDQTSNMGLIRSLRPNTQWLQVAHKAKATNNSWSTWIVHSFSEDLFPNLLGDESIMEVSLYQSQLQKFYNSKDFADLKIEPSELRAFMNSRTSESGAQEHKFAMSRKNIWISWQKSKESNLFLINISPQGQLPQAQTNDSPSFIKDWIFALLWLAASFVLLLWSYKKKLWCLSITNEQRDVLKLGEFREPGSEHIKGHAAVDKISRNREKDFCHHLLQDFGGPAELRLPGSAVVKVETSSSSHYKGSWWIIRTLSDGRIFLAVGDASGDGLAAVTSAYTIKYVLNKALDGGGTTEETEVLIQKLYDMASLSAEGVLLGSTHTSMFMTILDPESKIMAFINAGYPPPELKYSASKSIFLNSHADPLGLGSQTQPRPRWVNLTQQSQLTLCNIGCRNIDLTEVDESELLKIFVYPCGQAKEDSTEYELDVA